MSHSSAHLDYACAIMTAVLWHSSIHFYPGAAIDLRYHCPNPKAQRGVTSQP